MAAAPAFSWSGFYLGAQVGYGFSGTNNLSVNGTPVATWEEVQQEVYIENMGADLTLEVERAGGPAS